MKRVLFILSLVLFSCSTEETTRQQEEIVKPDFYVFLYEDCPSGGVFDKPYITESEYDKVIDYLRTKDEPCVIISLTDYLGEDYSGYYGGGNDPRN